MEYKAMEHLIKMLETDEDFRIAYIKYLVVKRRRIPLKVIKAVKPETAVELNALYYHYLKLYKKNRRI